MITTTAGAVTVALLEGAPAGLDIDGGELFARLVDGDEVLPTVVTITPILDTDTGAPLPGYKATFVPVPALPAAIEWLQQLDQLPAPATRVLLELVTGDQPAPTGAALCTLADVRGRRQTAENDTKQDVEVLRVITGVSAAIAREYKREFTPATAVTRTFELPCGLDRLVLVPYEIRTATLVRVNPGSDTPTELAATDYQLAPSPAEHGTYHRIRLRPEALPASTETWARALVEVTGDWGFDAIPAEVREAAILTVVHQMRVSVGQYSVADGAGGETRYERVEIPQAARDLLNPFEREDIYF